MRNIEHVIGHFGNSPPDYTHWLKVDGHYNTAEAARQALARAVEHHEPISFTAPVHEPRPSNTRRGTPELHADLRIGVRAGPGWISPDLRDMRHMIETTGELLAEWTPGAGYECPVDPACNAPAGPPPPGDLERVLEAIVDDGFIYVRDGKLVVETIAYEKFPSIDIDHLADLLDDCLMDAPAAAQEYRRTRGAFIMPRVVRLEELTMNAPRYAEVAGDEIVWHMEGARLEATLRAAPRSGDQLSLYYLGYISDTGRGRKPWCVCAMYMPLSLWPPFFCRHFPTLDEAKELIRRSAVRLMKKERRQGLSELTRSEGVEVLSEVAGAGRT